MNVHRKAKKGRRRVGCQFAHERIRENQSKQSHLVEYRMGWNGTVFLSFSFHLCERLMHFTTTEQINWHYSVVNGKFNKFKLEYSSGTGLNARERVSKKKFIIFTRNFFELFFSSCIHPFHFILKTFASHRDFHGNFFAWCIFSHYHKFLITAKLFVSITKLIFRCDHTPLPGMRCSKGKWKVKTFI